MRVLHIINGLSSGGAERALNNIIEGGVSVRSESAVISLRDQGVYGDRLKQAGVSVYELGLKRALPTPAALARLRTVVKAYRPAIIQGWMYHGNVAASLAALMAPGRPAVAWNIRHSLYGLSREKPLTRQVIRLNRLLSGRADAIIYNSHMSREQHEAFGFDSPKGVVIPNGFNTEALTPSAGRRAAARQTLGIGPDEQVVGHVARFHPMKDHAGFVRAAVCLLQYRPATRFLMIGRDVSLGHPALRGIVPDSLAGRFVTPGERSDVHELMQAMDVLCLSSAWGEAFPNVLGEAMASGVPCVTTDVGDSAVIVGVTGRVVPARSPSALANAISEMLSMQSEERAMLAQAGRERITARYSLPNVVQQYAELYKQLV